MISAANVVAEARTWIGTPWVHQHRTKRVAVDCAGLIIGVARELGVVAPDFDIQGYGRQPDGTLIARATSHMTPIPRNELAPGAVIVLSTASDPQHFGIVGDYLHGGLSIIHACDAPNIRRVVEMRLMLTRTFAFRAAFRLPGVEPWPN